MTISVLDPFGLPDWLGTEAVTWRSTSGLEGFQVRGCLRGTPQHEQGLDLLAVDAAYPVPVCPDHHRRSAHQAWQFGEVVLLDVDGRVAAGVPGSGFDANLVCEALRRVARSVGAETASFLVLLAL